MSLIERREKLYEWMKNEDIRLLMFEDSEHRRDNAVRWMSGQPSDALLFLSADKKSLLVAWDTNMAACYAQVDHVLPYTEFMLNPVNALRAAVSFFKLPNGSKIEIPACTSYTDFLKYVEALSDFDVICRSDGACAEVTRLRSVKDEEEIRIYRELSSITNEIINLIEKNVVKNVLKTESDVALFIEGECRKLGCEGTGFTTLAAGSARSFGIHAFPAYTSGIFADKGLSILDFGVVYKGYTSDVTMTFARGTLKKEQEKRLDLISEAFDLALSKVKNGASCKNIAAAVDTFFKKSKLSMPHGLGHGIGLQAHEAPYLRNRNENMDTLLPGMVFTIEPGLYDPLLGGCRYENDVLLTESGAEVLTKSKIVRL
ncbi:hypothetical protein AGMMS50212_04640 [Spirochaetia bacterium]|nr:hypothetical protein AGMMS50212_04640 [Spirochaetia bacterium]